MMVALLEKTETEVADFFVPVWKQDAVNERIEKLTKKAKKYGFNPPTIQWSDETVFNKVWLNDYQSVMVEYRQCTVEFEVIKAPGSWSFAAMIDKTESGNLISGPLSEQLGHYRTVTKLTCNHCKTERSRKKHYILKSDDGKTLMLGSTCVKDYFGHDCKDALAGFEFINWMKNPEECDVDSVPDDYYTESIKKVAEMTIAFIKQVGFISVTQARESYDFKTPTYIDVNHQLFGRKLKDSERIKPTEEEKALAATILEKWEAVAKTVELDKESANEWDYRKYLFIRNGYISMQAKQMSLCVGMIAREYKQIGIEKENEIAGDSVHFGTIGKRELFNLTITRIQRIESMYGDKEMICGVQTGTPNRFIWWNSGRLDEWIEGDVTVKATVKEHADHEKYGIQTVLSRVSLV